MSANLRSIDALREFRAALVIFIEEATLAVQSMLMEIQKSFEWIEHERPHYWNAQGRRAYDLLARARAELEICRSRTVAGHKPSCIEQKQALARAKQRLQQCEDQKEIVKQWGNKLRHETDEFRGRLATLQALLEGELPKGVARLDRTLEILEAYAEIDSKRQLGE